MTRVYFGLGTNLGDRAVNLARARDMLGREIDRLEYSRVFESDPVGIADQPRFLNQAAAGETALYPSALLAFLKGIEAAMGRLPTVRNGPRPIDLDLLFYGNWVLAVDGLVIPHPRLDERSFVLAPLAEIAPDLQHPITSASVAAMWAAKEPRLAKSWVFEPERTGV